MFDAILNGKDWNLCYESLPEEGIWVIVFRKNKYVIAKRVFLNSHENLDQTTKYGKWVTQHSLVYSIDDDDPWLEFKHIQTQKLHDS